MMKKMIRICGPVRNRDARGNFCRVWCPFYFLQKLMVRTIPAGSRSTGPPVTRSIIDIDSGVPEPVSYPFPL